VHLRDSNFFGLVVSLVHRHDAQVLNAVRNEIHDVPLSILILILANVELEVKHAYEPIGHLAHFVLCAVNGDAEENRLLLVAIQLELCGKCHGCMQNAFRVMLGNFCSFLPDLFNSGFQESLNIDEGRNHQVGCRIFEAPQVELDER